MKWIVTVLLVAGWVYARAQDGDSLDALKDVQALTTAPMADRASGSRGSRSAQLYIKARLRRAGVLPPDNTYEQPFFFTCDGRRIMGTNILGYVKGKRDDWIVVAAHYDHPPVAGGDHSSPDSARPRISDNAAGVAVLLTLASRLARQPAAHNILFIAFDAEQEGMQGALQWTAHAGNVLPHLKAFINLDGVGGSPGIRVIADTLQVYARAAAPEGKRYVVTVNRENDWQHTGDQMPFLRRGIPSVILSAREDTAGGSPQRLQWLADATNYTETLLRLMDSYLGIRLPPRSRWIMEQSRSSAPRRLPGSK